MQAKITTASELPVLPQEPQVRRNPSYVFPALGAGFCALIGVTSLLGWIFNLAALKSGWPGTVEMKANTSLCLIALGLSLWLQREGGKQSPRSLLSSRLLAGMASLIGLASFGEYLFGWDLGIDQLLFVDNPENVARSVRAGLMSPLNATNIALLGLALLFMDRTQERRFQPSLLLSFLVALLGVFNLLDFMLAPHGLHTYTSFPAALALAMLPISLISARPLPGDRISLAERFPWIKGNYGWVVRYGGAVLLVALATIARNELYRRFGMSGAVYITYYPVTVLAALLGGLGPGVLTTVLADAAVIYFSREPSGHALAVVGDLAGVLIFSATGIGISMLVESMERTRRRVAEQLRAASLYSRSLIEASLDPLVTISAEGKITDVNKATEEATGVARSGLIGADFANYFVEPDRARAGYRHVFERGQVTDYPLAIRHVSGRVTDVLYNARIYRDESGSVAGVFAAARDVTERKRAEEALRLQAQRYDTILKTTISGYWVIDRHGRLLEVNDSYCHMSGYTRQELLGLSIPDVEVLESPQQVAARINRVAQQGFEHFETRHRRKDGTLMDVEISVSYWAEKDQLLLFLRDITTRKRAEAELHSSLLYARSLIEASLDPLVTISAEGKITDVNRATEDATGVPRSVLIGTDFANYFTEPDKARAGYRQAFERGQVTDYPLALRHVSGRVKEVLYNASVYRDGQGSIAGLFAAARDVTERKRAEAELRASSMYARSLIEASLDPLVTISAEGKITDVNKATEEATGVPRSVLIGTDFANYFTEPDKARAGYRKAFERGQVTDYPLALRHVSDRLKEVLYNASVYRDGTGSVAGLFAAARDVTERKRAEEELLRYRQHLEELVEQRTTEIKTASQRLETSNQELETFAYSVSHDLRTPLRAVDGFSRILLEEYAPNLDSEGQRIVGVIRAGTRKMAQMIDDILAFSRAGRVDLSLRPINMEEMVHAVLRDLEPVLAGRDLKIDIKQMPPSHGDTGMIQRLWTNLLDNAVKFTKPRPQALIEVGGQAGDQESVYYVKDNGVGFDMQYAHKLFGVFQRLHAVDEFPGTGIGLAIVKRIVARHGGRVWAEGKVGEGATIYFALPRETK